MKIDCARGTQVMVGGNEGSFEFLKVFLYRGGKALAATRNPKNIHPRIVGGNVQLRETVGSQMAVCFPKTGVVLYEDFRAEAMDALSPLQPSASQRPIEPELVTTVANPTGNINEETQPVLPGAVRTLLLNSRPGVFYSLRHTLYTQATVPARLSQNWQARWDHPIVAVESFVDGQLFRGTA